MISERSATPGVRKARRHRTGAALILVLEQRVLLTSVGSGNPALVSNPAEGYPYRAAVSLRMTWDTNGNGVKDAGDAAGTCSGAMIGPHQVLTAAHCIFDRGDDPSTPTGGKGWADWIDVYAGRDGEQKPFFASSVSTTVPTSWGTDVLGIDGRRATDFGIIHLDRNLGNATGWFNYASLNNNTLFGQPLEVLHYPAFGYASTTDTYYDGTRQYYSDGSAVALDSSTIYVGLQDQWISKGSSGSPLFLSNITVDGTAYSNVIVGVTARGTVGIEPGQEGAGEYTRINSDVFARIGEWRDNRSAPVDLPNPMTHESWFGGTGTTAPNTYERGDLFRATTKVFNGSPTIAANVPVEWYLVPGHSGSSHEEYFVGGTYVTIHGYTTAEAVLEVPLHSIPDGDYELRWRVDPQGTMPGYGEGSDEGSLFQTITISSPVLSADLFESNNSFEQAFDLRGQYQSSGRFGLTLDHPGDVDYFRFTAARTGIHQISTQYAMFDGNIDVYLYDSLGNREVYSESITDNEILYPYLVEGEEYLLEFREARGGVGLYSFFISPPGVGSDSSEENDTFESATDLGRISEYRNEQLSYHQWLNTDYFRFEADRDGKLEVDLLFIHEYGDINLQLYDEDRNFLGSSFGFEDFESIVRTVSAGDVFYIAVTGANLPNEYELRIRIDDPVPTLVGFDPELGRWWRETIEEESFVGLPPGFWPVERDWVNLHVADINGDFRQDAIGRDRETGEWFVGLGRATPTGLTFGPPQLWGTWDGWRRNADWRDILFDDFNNDGRVDVLGLTAGGTVWLMTANAGGNGFDEESEIGRLHPANTWRDLSAGDFNGDGFLEIVARSEQGGGWWLLTPDIGTFSYQAPRWVASWRTDRTWQDVTVADLNGDGLDDLIGRTSTGNSWMVMLGRREGAWFRPVAWTGVWTYGHEFADVRVVDITGDGLADLVGRSKQSGEWLVSPGTMLEELWAGFGDAEVWATWDGWRRSRPWIHTRYGDFDADGRLDLVSQAATGGAWWLMRGNASGDGFEELVVLEIWNPQQEWDVVVPAVFHPNPFATMQHTKLVGFSRQSRGWHVAGADPQGSGQYVATRLDGGLDPRTEWGNIQRGDFNGDGITDLIALDLNSLEWFVMLGAVEGFHEPVRWAAFDQGWQRSRTWFNAHAGDIDGDGRDDILVQHDGGAFFIMLAHADGDRFHEEVYYSASNPAVASLDPLDTDVWYLEDVNGDGNADLFAHNTDTNQFYLALAKPDGSGFWKMWASRRWNPSRTWIDFQVADFDNDGRTDVLGRALEGGGWYLMTGGASGFAREVWVGSFDPRATWRNVLVADVTGDGQLDLIGRETESGRWFVMVSTGAGTFATPTRWRQWGGWKRTSDWFDTMAADFNRDGKADLLVQSGSGGWWLMLANNDGTAFVEERWLGNWSVNTDWGYIGLV